MPIRHPRDPRDLLARAHLYLVAGAPVTGSEPADESGDERWVARVVAAVAGGVDAIQIRWKHGPTESVVRLARKLKAALPAGSALILVNDDLEAAVRADADGVHFGQGDGSVASARSRLAPGRLVGISTHSLAQARAAELAGADYLGCGAAFTTATKEVIELIGPRAIGAVVRATQLPVFAIGGITLGNVGALRAEGIDRIAVSAAIERAPDPEGAARALRAALRA